MKSLTATMEAGVPTTGEACDILMKSMMQKPAMTVLGSATEACNTAT